MRFEKPHSQRALTFTILSALWIASYAVSGGTAYAKPSQVPAFPGGLTQVGGQHPAPRAPIVVAPVPAPAPLVSAPAAPQRIIRIDPSQRQEIIERQTEQVRSQQLCQKLEERRAQLRQQRHRRQNR